MLRGPVPGVRKTFASPPARAIAPPDPVVVVHLPLAAEAVYEQPTKELRRVIRKNPADRSFVGFPRRRRSRRRLFKEVVERHNEARGLRKDQGVEVPRGNDPERVMRLARFGLCADDARHGPRVWVLVRVECAAAPHGEHGVQAQRHLLAEAVVRQGFRPEME